MNRTFLIIALLASTMLVKAQLSTEPLRSAKDTANGMIYTLPRTLLEFEVDIRQTDETPGQYFQYAERFLGTKDFIQEKNSKFEITGVRVKVKAIADPSQIFLISSGKKGKDFRFDWSPEGFLLAINGKEEPKHRVPVVSETGKETPSSAPKDWETRPNSIYTKEMQLAGSTAKMAELAANQLFTIREARLNLLTQDVDHTPSDGRAYEITLSELNRAEQFYLELFQGTKTVVYQTVRFQVNPETEKRDVLFRFSSLVGVLDKNNLGGDPYFLTIKRLPSEADAIRQDAEPSQKGIYYRIPGKASIQLSDGKNNLFSDSFTINQFGKVIGLPASQFRSLELSPATGGLIQLER
jgi:hypothetical protein